jgi:hypothetical protein
VILIPLTSGLYGESWYFSRSAAIARLIALGVVCLAISIIHIVSQWKHFSIWSGRQGGRPSEGLSIIPWHGAILLAVSAIALVIMTGLLLGAGGPGSWIPAETLDYVVVTRLIALGGVAFTVVVVNTVFHLKR